MAKRKIYKTNPIRKYIIITLFIFFIIGIGYSILGTLLNINGTVQLKKYEEPTLYNVLRNEALSGGLAKEYTGGHNDSYDTSLSTENIYYWYASTTTEGDTLANKTNVIFGNHCWIMVRTTDTGGTKLLYNGEAENNQCLSSRANHIGYNGFSSSNANNKTYWYSNQYIYDKETNLFSLTGDLEQVQWNNETYINLIGKYTCFSTTQDGTCNRINYIIDSSTTSYAYYLIIDSNSLYNEFGKTKYTESNNSLASSGYMLGYNYGQTAIRRDASENLEEEKILFNQNSENWKSYWYADSISYDQETHTYTLIDPYKIDLTSYNADVVGKYTLKSIYEDSESDFSYYIGRGYNSESSVYLFYMTLSDGKLLSDVDPIMVSDSITYQGDGTYILNDPTPVYMLDYVNNFSNYNNKYTCNSTGTSCSNPALIFALTSDIYFYYYPEKKIVVGDARDEYTLVNPTTITMYELINNIDNYKGMYTCRNESSVCNETNISIINDAKEYSHGVDSYIYYSFYTNRYYAENAVWDGEKYILENTIEMENHCNNTAISSHHYICIEPGLKECSDVYYIYYYNSSYPIYWYTVKLTNGVDIETAYNLMLRNNEKDSLIKTAVEEWYKQYMLPYDNYIEDAIVCAGRKTNPSNGWVQNGPITSRLEFDNNDYSCDIETDKFSISNNSAKLKYKVGLMTKPEYNMSGKQRHLNSTNQYWLITPAYFADSRISDRYVYRNYVNRTSLGSSVSGTYGVRPVISLKPGIKYTSGDGSKDNPYIVDTN